MSNDRPRLGAILTRWEIILLYFLAAVIVLNGVLSPYFLNVTNILFSTFNFTEKAIMALPMMFIIICADIDISVASIVALSSVFMGMAAARGVAGADRLGCGSGPRRAQWAAHHPARDPGDCGDHRWAHAVPRDRLRHPRQ